MDVYSLNLLAMKSPFFLLLGSRDWNSATHQDQQSLLEGIRSWAFDPEETNGGVSLVGAFVQSWRENESVFFLDALDALIQRGCPVTNEWDQHHKTASIPLAQGVLIDGISRFSRTETEQCLAAIRLIQTLEMPSDGTPAFVAKTLVKQVKSLPNGWGFECRGLPLPVWLIQHAHTWNRGLPLMEGSDAARRVVQKRRLTAFFDAVEKAGGFSGEGVQALAAAALAGATVQDWQTPSGVEETQHARMLSPLSSLLVSKSLSEVKALIEGMVRDTQQWSEAQRKTVANGLLVVASHGLKKLSVEARASYWEVLYAGFGLLDGVASKKALPFLLHEPLKEIPQVASDWVARPGGVNHALRVWLSTHDAFQAANQTATWLNALQEAVSEAGVAFSPKAIKDFEQTMPYQTMLEKNPGVAQAWGQAQSLVRQAGLNDAWAKTPDQKRSRPRM